MSLKKKIILLLLGLFALYGLIEFAVQRLVLLPAFVQLEAETATSNTQRAVQALANAVVRALKWLQTAGPSDIVRGVPESAMSGDRAIYLAALDKVREAFSPDGVLGEEAVQTAHRLVAQQAQAQAAVRAAAPAATYTNEFVLRARQRFAA